VRNTFAHAIWSTVAVAPVAPDARREHEWLIGPLVDGPAPILHMEIHSIPKGGAKRWRGGSFIKGRGLLGRV